jgi:hypothetical protein
MKALSNVSLMINRVLLAALLTMFADNAQAQTIPAYVSSAGLQGWYPFDGNANNAFGTGKNGVVLGPVLTTDRFGNPNSAYHFNGNGDHINLDTAFFNVGWSGYSVSCWLNSDTLTNPYAYANDQSYFNTVPHNGLDLAYNYSSNNKYTFFANSRPDTSNWDILGYQPSSASITIHTWDHVVFTKTSDTVYRFYLNGSLDKTFTTSQTAMSYYCKIILGRIDTTHFYQGFMGKLDDFGIWSRSLSQCEVLRLYNSTAYSYVTAQPVSVTTSPGSTIHFSITDTGTGNTYQWQQNSGAGYANLSGTGTYSGVTTATLTVTGVTSAMSGYKFRCVVTGALPCVDTSAFGLLSVGTTRLFNITSNVVSITPNPAFDYVYVSGIDKANILVYNLLGQLVAKAYDADHISISELPMGMYVVKVCNQQNDVLKIGKIVKR